MLPARLRSWNLSRAKLLLLALLLALVAIGAAPSYLSQQWAWKMPPPVLHLKQLREIRETGVPMPPWNNVTEQKLQLGDHHWYLQNLSYKDQKATLFLMPQSGPRRQPQVEWSDIEGIQRWQSDSYSTLKINVENPDQTFETRFFRAWTRGNTYGVVQWYAQSDGGSPMASKWYLADRRAQWQRQRVPWIAVSVQFPMEPLGNLSQYQDSAIALAKDIQRNLNQQIFHPKPTSPT